MTHSFLLTIEDGESETDAEAVERFRAIAQYVADKVMEAATAACAIKRLHTLDTEIRYLGAN